MIASLVMDFQRVIATTVVVMITYMVIGGFYVRHLPFWLKWAQYATFINYGYHAMLQFVFRHEHFRYVIYMFMYVLYDCVIVQFRVFLEHCVCMCGLAPTSLRGWGP